MEKLCRFGTNRVIEPKGVLPQAATKIDNTMIVKDNEILIRSNLEVSDQMIEMYKANKARETMRQYGYNKDGNISTDKIKNAMPSVGYSNKV